MARMTPEGKVKEKLLRYLRSINCFYYMPVQNGMGQTGIPDVMACIKGRTVGLECKATPKQHPTTLQAFQLQKLQQAGGVAWVVDNESVNEAIANIKATMENEHYSVGDNLLPTSPLYRWKSKLEVMEFGNGTGD